MGLMEKDVTLAVGLEVERLLRLAGHVVLLTRSDDRFVSLDARARAANAFGADAFVSIHCNSAVNRKAEGWEVWTSPGQTEGDRLATCLFNAWHKAFPSHPVRADWSDGDVDKEARFRVLMKTTMPSALVELAFISNANEEYLLSLASMQRAFARALADGIEAWCGQ